MTSRDESVGWVGFIERHGLWSDEDVEAAARAQKIIEERDLELVRFSFADQHGILRGKSLVVVGMPQALRNGCTITTTLLAKDTSHRTVFPVFTAGGGFGMPEMGGAGDVLMVPDPKTFRVLPWASRTGWVLCDLYFHDGRPVPFSTRQICRAVLGDLREKGYDYVSGLELEFHLFKLEDPMLRPENLGQPADPPRVSVLAHGLQYLTETRFDELEPVLEILRRDLLELGLPLRSIESEFGASQAEITFHPGEGLETADMTMLFRSAVKQICRRHGYHATFMCKPGIPNLFASGWHLHQSLLDRRTGKNAFLPTNGDEILSEFGLQFVAGLIEHAGAASVFTTPTINGYKRYHQPFALAPTHANWGRDNKGAMIRAVGGVDDPASRIENRVGDPAANPYLYTVSQILAGMDGVERALVPPPPADTPYETDAARLPGSLIEALAALRVDTLFRDKLGDTFVDYILTLKGAEIERFLSVVTDWEHREYFEIF